MVLANALESKDYETQEHSTRLVGMSDAIARHLGTRRRRAQRHPIRRLPPRHRQGGDPRGVASQTGGADARGARRSCRRIPRSAPRSSPTSTPGRTSGSSSGITTSISTARGYPDGLRGDADPARRPHRVGRRRLRRHAHRPPVSTCPLVRLDPRGAAAGERPAVRPRDGRGADRGDADRRERPSRCPARLSAAIAGPRSDAARTTLRSRRGCAATGSMIREPILPGLMPRALAGERAQRGQRSEIAGHQGRRKSTGCPCRSAR